MSSKLTQYKGPLDSEGVVEGIAIARRNATRLIEDAEALAASERYPSAIALAVLAIEELGKVQILKTIAVQFDEKALKSAWREYRSHRAKNVMWVLPGLAAGGAKTLGQVRQAADVRGDHTLMLENVKQLALYTDCLNEKPQWTEPIEAIDPNFAPSIIEVAKILNRERETTAREIELWIEHVGNHYGKPTMPTALLSFQKAMFEEGLTQTPPEKLESFMKGTLISIRDES